MLKAASCQTGWLPPFELMPDWVPKRVRGICVCDVAALARVTAARTKAVRMGGRAETGCWTACPRGRRTEVRKLPSHGIRTAEAPTAPQDGQGVHASCRCTRNGV